MARPATASLRLTVAERCALTTMAFSRHWCILGQRTTTTIDTGARPRGTTRWFRSSVHSATAARLEKRGLAKSRAELPDGSVVTGADLVRFLGHWHTAYTATAAGLRAVGKKGKPLR